MDLSSAMKNKITYFFPKHLNLKKQYKTLSIDCIYNQLDQFKVISVMAIGLFGEKFPILQYVTDDSDEDAIKVVFQSLQEEYQDLFEAIEVVVCDMCPVFL
jgi:hypothetical protein